MEKKEKQSELSRMSKVCERFSISRPTVYRLMKDDFPKPIKVGRSSLWINSELDSYELGQMKKRDLITK